MKKFLSVFLVAAMLIAALAMVACGEKPGDETTTTTTEATTEATTTTTEETTVTTTTEATTTTTETTTTETTTTEETTTTISTEPVFARFDFGTKSYASENNLTSHEYLTSKLTYNDKYVSNKYDEDNIIVTALQSYNYGSMRTTDYKSVGSIVNAYALCYEDISADYEFDDPQEIHAGQAKVGCHQYMKIRYVNGGPNTKISFLWRSTTVQGWSTTTSCVMDVTPGKAKEGYDNYQIAIFDVARESNLPTGANEITDDNGVGPGNNWIWQGSAQYITCIRFHILGSYVPGYARKNNVFATTGNNLVDDGNGNMIAGDGSGKTTSWSAGEAISAAKVVARCDTRGLIKKGNFVKIDYILFGVSPEQLMEYKSNMERAAE